MTKSLELFAKTNPMNTKILISVTAASLIAVTTLSGCANRPTRAQIGTATGAVVGGVVANAAFGGTLATVGGAAAGAVIGNELSKKR